MSQIRMEMVWQHEQMLPYLLEELKQKIEAITPVRKMYLFGSRARVPFKDWKTLKGKDWDVLVVCDFKIVNTQIWARDANYHLDLMVTDPEGENHFLEYNKNILELYPENQLVLT